MKEKELDTLRDRAEELDRLIADMQSRLLTSPDNAQAKELALLAQAIRTLTCVKRDLYRRPSQPEQARQKLARDKLKRSSAPGGISVTVKNADPDAGK